MSDCASKSVPNLIAKALVGRLPKVIDFALRLRVRDRRGIHLSDSCQIVAAVGR